MSDARVLLVFILVPLLLGLRWFLGERVPLPILLALGVGGGMLLLIVWMVIELRAPPGFG